jgi:hypothetical protein
MGIAALHPFYELLRPTEGSLMKIYIANLGFENAYWPVCLSENVLTLYTSKKLFECWNDGDREGWLEWATRNARMINGHLATKSVASRWFNLLNIFHETSGDVWVHRDGEKLFWTKSLPGRISISSIPDPFGRSNPYVLLKRPVDQWRNSTKLDRKILWKEIHPKARDFLQTEATYQEVANDRGYRDYVDAFLNDRPLDAWHNRAEWKEKLGQANLVKVFSPLEKTIYDAILRIRSTVSGADGRIVETTAKIKELTVPEDDFRRFLKQLYLDQDGRCTLTGLRMLLNGEEGSDDFRLSVDRIDSNGHYDPENVQLVCRFANLWKSDRDDARFKELVQIVKES